MPRSAKAHALGNRILNVKPSAETGTQHVGENPGECNDSIGDGSNAADLLAERNADGCGNTLGEQGKGHDPVQGKNPSQQVHAAHTADAAKDQPQENGTHMFFEILKLLIEGNGKADGGRCQKKIQDLTTCLVGTVGDVQQL